MVKKPSQQALNRAAVTVEQAEALALRNKRNGKDPKNVSAIVRVALEQYLKTLT